VQVAKFILGGKYVSIPYYNEKKKEYSSPKGQGQKIFIGRDTSLMSDGFTHINHDDFIESNSHAKTLWVAGSKCDIPDIGDLIEKFPNVEKLGITRDLVPFKKIDLSTIRAFTLNPYYDTNLANETENHLWLREQVMPNVEFFRSFNKRQADDFCGITPENLPNLKWIECEVDNKKSMLKAIHSFKNVTALQAKNVGKQDIFDAFENRLQILSMSGRFAGFPMQKISNQTTLEILFINSYKQEFNMEWLLNLKLKEIQLLNCLNVINAEALLEMDCLESLFVLNCKNALPAELKLKFKERNFAYLNIDFA